MRAGASDPQVPPNTYYAGFVTFEVPADMSTDLTLVYAPSFLTATYEIPLPLS